MDFNPFKQSISELNQKEVEKGSVLVSEPFMGDDYFKRSVVYMAEHNEEGSIGFLLNKPTEIKLNELFVDFPEFDANVFLGGPVQSQSLFFIHKYGHLIKDSIPLNNGLFWNGDFEDLKIRIGSNEINRDGIKFFLGYSGWGVNQLEEELKENSWFIQNLDPDSVLKSDAEKLWKQVLQNADKRVSLMANFPEDPSLN